MPAPKLGTFHRSKIQRREREGAGPQPLTAGAAVLVVTPRPDETGARGLDGEHTSDQVAEEGFHKSRPNYS